MIGGPNPASNVNSVRPDRNGLAQALMQSYLGLLIKFVLPAGFVLVLVFNLQADGAESYNGIDEELLLTGGGFTVLGLMMMILPICCCDEEDKLDEVEIDKEIAEITEMQAM